MFLFGLRGTGCFILEKNYKTFFVRFFVCLLPYLDLFQICQKEWGFVLLKAVSPVDLSTDGCWVWVTCVCFRLLKIITMDLSLNTWQVSNSSNQAYPNQGCISICLTIIVVSDVQKTPTEDVLHRCIVLYIGFTSLAKRPFEKRRKRKITL